jgi:catechol 2,3-dioxygenase-like lactoylglutathione lyase family enzyme
MSRLPFREREKPGQAAPRRVALATCRTLPDLDEDTRRLIGPLAARGISATPAVWDDPAVDWASFDLVVIRSCWDYVQRHNDFLEWTSRVTHLANPPAVIAWNTHKTYLRTLEVRGIPIVPTTWLQPEEGWTAPETGDWIIKPAVSLASLDSGKYRMDDPAQRRLAVEHVRRLHAANRTVMLQPYMHRIDEEGETALVYLGGVFSHAMRKAAVLTGPDEGVDRRFLSRGGLQLRLHQPTARELRTAKQVLAAVPGGAGQLLYARVDLVAGVDGPTLMELELTEPQLYFRDAAGAADRMAAAIDALTFAKAPAQPQEESGRMFSSTEDIMRQVKIVGLLVKDYDAAIQFYTQKLGFEVAEDAASGDRRWITLSLPGNHCALALELAKSPEDLALVGRQAGSFPLLALDTADCAGDYQALKARGVTFRGEPKTGPWGTGVLLEDLYGNKVFLSQEV